MLRKLALALFCAALLAGCEMPPDPYDYIGDYTRLRGEGGTGGAS
jgi:hypothetical protein